MKKEMTELMKSAACLLAAAACFACGDTEYIDVPRAAVGLTPSTDIVFTSDGGERTIAVRTNQQEWTVSSDQPWCVVTQTPSADGFVVSAAPNPSKEALPEATVTVTTSADRIKDNFATMSFKVNQNGFDLVDLSAGGCANCYVISKAGYYKFYAGVQGQSKLATVADFSGCSADWIWSTQEGVLEVEPAVGPDGYISFVCRDFKPGNAVLALIGDGKVVWTWHIWLTQEPLLTRERNIMCVNLGATSDRAGEVSHFGLFYQWGRKDPFIGSAGVGHYPQQVLSYHEQTPFAIGSDATDGESYTAPNVVNTSLVAGWNTTNDKTPRTHAAAAAEATTFYTSISAVPNASTIWQAESDPCPPGWHVPSMNELGGYFASSYSALAWPDYQGVIRGEDHAPAQGYRNFQNGRLSMIGRSGWYWSSEASSYDYMHGYNYAIGFEEQNFARTNICITYGFSVRCAKE